MEIKPSEISQILKSRITNFSATADVSETGVVTYVGDGVARVHGLTKAAYTELVEFVRVSAQLLFDELYELRRALAAGRVH